MNQDMKYGYLDETYETICPLGEQDIFLAKNRDNGRIFVKKYVAASVIPVYEKLIADRKSTRLNSSHQPQSRMPSSA